MCTVSWLHHEQGYDLLCNRDEKRTRPKAYGPEIRDTGGVRYIAPVDSLAGGSWIAANEFGLSLCLLNGKPQPSIEDRTFSSRGLLIPELISAASIDSIYDRVRRCDLSGFAPFSLAVLEPGRHTSVIEWDGSHRSILPYAEPLLPLVSSSFDPIGVLNSRRAELDARVQTAGQLTLDVLFALHGSHAQAAGAYSSCMHRPDAETVSFSWIRVMASRVEVCYSAGPPCRSQRSRTLGLSLVH
jgi:hypothetical protein